MASPSSFTISTLRQSGAGLAPGSPELELRGRALPYREPGLVLEGSMRAEFTWYPGNAVATVQMLGAEEKSTVISGMWKDKFLKSATDEGRVVQPDAIALADGQQVVDVFDLVARVEAMRLAGQLLEVKWDGLTRHGLLLRFRQTWLRREDVQWELEFGWVSRGEVQTAPTLPLVPSANDFSDTVRGLTSRLQDALTSPPFQVVEDFTAAVESAVAEIDDAVLEVENAVTGTVQQVSAPVDAAERTLAAAESIKRSASSIVTTVETYPPVEIIKTGSISALTLGDALAADVYSRGLKLLGRQLELAAAEQGEALRASTRQEVLLASFVAPGPMDLREVSTRFYGQPDGWRTLLEYNRMETSTLTAGALVLVPRVDFAGRGA